ncbi:hypothetical protein PRCB_09235 [Pantoea rodasii]|uniref:Uncharacterized protein n=1 Tax=Pantoea rodasii TaxID=1076549 RepID=A0A2M9WEB1_9GAMM|nr:hypothetical protein [Pantoea rodasii]ORM61182.1 hypothetical protein HA45_21070 [Pantoea rodasii]PJZ05839.1 hypothetical protein PRCB_09235 [Pantoea rodasii]
MSHSLLHELLPRRLHACEAVRTTQARKKELTEEALARSAAPHVEKVIAEIEKAAMAGRGKCSYTFETDSDVAEFACDYIRMTGYQVEEIAEKGNGYTVVIHWWE